MCQSSCVSHFFERSVTDAGHPVFVTQHDVGGCSEAEAFVKQAGDDELFNFVESVDEVGHAFSFLVL